jgi:hypothetical protein
MILQNYNPDTFPQNRWWYRLYLIIIGTLCFITTLLGIGFIYVGWNTVGGITILGSFGFFVVMRALLLFIATGSWRGTQKQSNSAAGDNSVHNGGKMGSISVQSKDCRNLPAYKVRS